MTVARPRIHPSYLTTLAAFLLAALGQWLPSGYSYGALILLAGALFQGRLWWRARPADRQTRVLTLLLLGMGLMWFGLSLDTGWGRWDKGGKWLLGALCLQYVVAFAPHPRAFFYGLPLGCMGMGVLAFWQVWGLGWERAGAHTNEIQWGNGALLLACFCGVSLAVFWQQLRWPWRGVQLLAMGLGLSASLLSQSRGGWLALLALLALWWLVVWRIRPQLLGRLTALSLGLLLALALVLATVPRFQERIALAQTQISAYFVDGVGETSLGVRLQQYQLATQLIPQKPWLGWGAQGFVQEMQRRVTSGEYTPAMVHYPEIHNTFLDAWVKVGLVGLLMQLALFAWLLYLFWPSRARLARFVSDSPDWRTALALRVMGCSMAVAYVVFGMTQPFFNHNSGVLPFIFYTAVLWAGLLGLERGHWPAVWQSPHPSPHPKGESKTGAQ